MRMKPKNSIKNRTDAEAAMAKLNNIDMQLAAWDLDEANEIAGVRERHAGIQKKGGRIGHEAEKALILKELESWAESDVRHWEKKTMETSFGNMGFRLSTPAVVLIKKIARNFKEALELLTSRMPEYVRPVPEIDKEAILAASRDETLKTDSLEKCGLKVDQEDEFWVETNASRDLEDAAKRLRAA